MELITFLSVWWTAVAGLMLIAVSAILQHTENLRLAETEQKERRYLEAVAMLTAEEKREIGIE